MPPQFWNNLFCFEITPTSIQSHSSYPVHTAYPVQLGKTLLCPQPFIFSSAQRESADSPSVFLPPRPSIRSKTKGYAGARNRFTFPALGYKSPHRHCILFIGQSFLCLLLLPAQKTLASSPSSRQTANNKRIGEGSSVAPPPLRPCLG